MPTTTERQPAALPLAVRGRSALSYRHYTELAERLRRHRRELLLACEHPATITLGLQTKESSLLTDSDELNRLGITLERVRRGGDATAHESGQLLLYPHIDLRRRSLRIGDLFTLLLNVSQSAIEECWGLKSEQRKEAPGLYLGPAKLLSIGLTMREEFSSSGVALNLSNNLTTFRHIHPCGEAGLPLTSIERAGGDKLQCGNFITTFHRQLQLRLHS